jgi:Zn-dependent M28 family amino/carboxypeptidase
LLGLAAFAVALCACTKEDTDVPQEATTLSSPIAVEAAGGDPATETAAGMITDEYMREIIAEISSDAYEGRGPGTRGDAKTRQYLIARMQELGLEPGGEEGSWEQPVDLVGLNTDQPPTWTFEGQDASLTFKQWDQYMINSDLQEPHAEVTNAEVVFVGYGIQAPEYDWDDYKDADVTGKVVLIMNNDPDWDSDLFEGETRLWYGRWDYKYQKAADMGAVGAIIIHTTPSASYPFQVIQTSNTGVQFELPAGDEIRKQFDAWMAEDAVIDLVEMAGFDLDELREAAYNSDFEPVPLGVTTSIAMDVDVQRVQSANVLGLIPGSDPILRDEVVILSAHHDHLGIGPPNEEGDTIYNGAYDNASGVALAMGIARAIKALPEAPRRSILIALVAAEEQGLLGSKWYARYPTFAPGKIAANINFDTVNVRGETHDVTYIGLGKTSIDELTQLIAAEQGREVRADQAPHKGSFYRSDQFSFARIGVPAAYLDPGMSYVDRPEGWGQEQDEHYTKAHYHQPSDEYDPSWNLDGMVLDAQLAYWVGLAIANTDKMQSWNEGDEFERARLKALAAEEE